MNIHLPAAQAPWECVYDARLLQHVSSVWLELYMSLGLAYVLIDLLLRKDFLALA